MHYTFIVINLNPIKEHPYFQIGITAAYRNTTCFIKLLIRKKLSIFI